MPADQYQSSPKKVTLTPDGRLFRPIVILGSWGSGTSALTKVFEGLGYYSCPPHHPTNDPRTPNSYEPRLLRNMMIRYFDELTLQRNRGDSDAVTHNLGVWYSREEVACHARWKRGVVFKLPHLCFYVPELYRALNPHFIVVNRAPEKIEQTRARRNWDMSLGQRGAEACQHAMIGDLNALGLPYHPLQFENLLENPREQLINIGQFLDAKFSQRDLDKGCGVLFKK